MNSELKYQKSLEKSIRRTDKIAYVPKRVKIKKDIRKAFAVFFALAITGALIIGAANGVSKISDYQEVKAIQAEEMIRVSSKLIDNDLFIVPDEHNQWRNNYFNVDDLNNNDIYGFYYYFGNSDANTRSEFDKILNALGYSNMDNFLHMNGYFDTDGNASISVWKNYEEARLGLKEDKVK